MKWLKEFRKYQKKQKKMRKKYCHKGFHKLSIRTTTWKHSGKRKIKIEYLVCLYCDYKFFANKKDKEKYQKQSREWHDLTKELFSHLAKRPLRGTKTGRFNVHGRVECTSECSVRNRKKKK